MRKSARKLTYRRKLVKRTTKKMGKKQLIKQILSVSRRKKTASTTVKKEIYLKETRRMQVKCDSVAVPS